MREIRRTSGILLPLFSLPSPYGIGTLGKEAFEFADFLTECNVGIWQLLPLNVTSYGDSPYQSPSSRGLNYYFIDLRELVSQGLLTKREIDSADFGNDQRRIDYGKMFTNRVAVLKKAFSRYDKKNIEFLNFVNEGKYNDFAFFMTLKSIHSFDPWYSWPEDSRNYTPELEERVKRENQDLYLFYVWTQFEFLNEYTRLKKYCNERNISLLGDMPLYLAYDSVEAYKYPELFLFDEKHNPTVVSGVPPDYFSETGQLWGNPIYDWNGMKEDGYSWFSRRIQQNLELFDILRIDHFRGFSSYYAIPFGMHDAKIGEWRIGPGMDLFKDKKELSIVAEDLGTLSDDVKELLKHSGYPGMKVLEFAFDGLLDNPHKPRNSTENFYCYTGTHDNMPLKGYLEQLSESEYNVFKEDVRRECEFFQVPFYGDTMRDLVLTVDTLCYASTCRCAILPFQDLLASGKETRINLPSSLSSDNWTYRIKASDFSPSLKSFIHRNIKRYERG